MQALLICSVVVATTGFTNDGSKLVWRTNPLCERPLVAGLDHSRLGVICHSGAIFALKLGCSISGDGGTITAQSYVPGTVFYHSAPKVQTLGVTLSSPAPIVYCNSTGAYLATLLTATALVGPSSPLPIGPLCPSSVYLSPLLPTFTPTPALAPALVTVLAAWNNGSAAIAAAVMDGTSGVVLSGPTLVCTVDEASPWLPLSLPPVLLLPWTPGQVEGQQPKEGAGSTMLLAVQYKGNSSFGVAWIALPAAPSADVAPPSCSSVAVAVLPLPALPATATVPVATWQPSSPSVTGGPLTPGQACNQPLVLHMAFSNAGVSGPGSIALYSLPLTGPAPACAPLTPPPGFTLSWAYTGGSAGAGDAPWLSTGAVPLYSGRDASALLLGSWVGSVWSLASSSSSSLGGSWDAAWWMAGTENGAVGPVLSDGVTAAVSFSNGLIQGLDTVTGAVLWEQRGLLTPAPASANTTDVVLQIVADTAGHLYVLTTDGSVALLDDGCPTIREARVYLPVAVLGILANVLVFALACWARAALAPVIQGRTGRGKFWGAGTWGGRLYRPLLGPESAGEGALQWEAWLLQSEDRATEQTNSTELEAHRVQAILRSWPWWKRWLAQGHVPMKQQ